MRDPEDVIHWSRVICNPINHTEKAVLMLVGMGLDGNCHLDAESLWIPKSCVKFDDKWNAYYVKDDFINNYFKIEITKFVR